MSSLVAFCILSLPRHACEGAMFGNGGFGAPSASLGPLTADKRSKCHRRRSPCSTTRASSSTCTSLASGERPSGTPRRAPRVYCRAPASRPAVAGGVPIYGRRRSIATCEHSPPLCDGPRVAFSVRLEGPRAVEPEARSGSEPAQLVAGRRGSPSFAENGQGQPTHRCSAIMACTSMCCHAHTRPCVCSSWTNKLIPAKDHGSIQVNIGHLDEEGVYKTGQYTTFALHGTVRATVRMPDHTPLAQPSECRLVPRAASNENQSVQGCPVMCSACYRAECEQSAAVTIAW